MAGEHFQHAGQNWNCLQVENESEARDALDWPVDDELMKQWEEDSEDEEEITLKKWRRYEVQQNCLLRKHI